MKKLILGLLIIAVSVIVYAEDITLYEGTDHEGQNYRFVLSDDIIFFESSDYKAKYYVILPEDDLLLITEAFKKAIEWQEIAKNNSISETSKLIDTIDSETLMLHFGGDFYKCKKQQIKLAFAIIDNVCVVGILPITYNAISNEFIDFESPTLLFKFEDVQKMAIELQKENMQKLVDRILKEREEKNNLFK
jgi:hypothetical protein